MDNKLNILYICPDHTLGGSTQSLLNMIEAVKEYVYPIVLIPSDGPASQYCKMHNIECLIQPYIRLFAVANHPWSRIIREPWKARPIKYARMEISCIYRVMRYLKGRKIDIVHSNYGPIYIGAVLSKLLHAKHVWHIREFCDLDFHMNIYGGLERLRRKVNKADARIAISNAIKEHWHLTEKNTWVINNAIRSKKDLCFVSKKEKYLLFSSYYITEHKGARAAIIAFAKSGVSKQGYTLKLIGNCDAEYKKSLLNSAKEYGEEKNVEFMPCQSNLKPYFAHATVYIMASEFEAMGRVTGEAMFYGCPVIAHATGGTLDLVRHGETGYLYHTIEECAEYIQSVCAEDQESLILRAQKYAVNHLSQEVYGPKIMEVYSSLLTQ